MSVSLVWITPNAEQLIASMARVSSHEPEDRPYDKLIGYLIRHKHWSPFEMASMCVEVRTTRDISRQILRHRSFSFQEFSQRYAEVPAKPVYRKARMQDPMNRQNSTDDAADWVRGDFRSAQERVWYLAMQEYTRSLIGMGIAKEQARALLPEGLTPTRLYMTGTLRSWIHYCEVRRDKGTQLEHREIAEDAWQIIVNECPLIASAVSGEVV